MIKKHFRIFILSCVFMLSCVFAVGLLPSIKTQAEDAVGADTVENITYDKATVYDLYDIVGEKDFTSGAEKNRNIGQMPSTHNVAFKAKFSYDESSKKILIINFIMGHKQTVNTEYFLRDCGYMFYFRDNTARLVYCGDGTETNQLVHTAAQLDWAELSAKLSTIDNLDGNGKISAEEWRYGREAFEFEMGYVKAYTGDEWTGNYVYVKINGTELMGFTDTSAYYQDKGTYFGKGATGYDYTFYTFSTTYESLPGVDTLDNIRAVKTAIETLPNAENIVWRDKETVENVRKMYDALTDNEKSYISDISRLTDAENMIWFLRGNATADKVVVYDLFDINGDKANTYTTETGVGRKVGYFQETSNIAFKTKVSFDVYDKENYNPLFFEIFILQKNVTSGASDYGYLFRWRNNQIQILYDANPIVAGDGDDTVGASVGKNTPKLSETEEFIVEFGCAKYIAYGKWYANYVYVKINDEEVLHFIDNGDYFQDKGKIVVNGIYGGWNSYTFNSLYDFAEITMGEASQGTNFIVGDIIDVPLNSDYKMPIPTKIGYCISSAKIDGVDVTDKIVLTEDGYALDCASLSFGGVLTVETSKKQISVSVEANENVQVEISEYADIFSVMEARIATNDGYVLSSFKINGIEYINEIELRKDGYYYCTTYRFSEDVTIETETVERRYSVVIYSNDGGITNCVENVGAFGSVVLTITPDENYLIASVLLNGEAVNVNSEGKVIIDRAMQDMQFDIRFAQKPMPVDTSVSISSGGCRSVLGSEYNCFYVIAISTIVLWGIFARKNKKV